MVSIASNVGGFGLSGATSDTVARSQGQLSGQSMARRRCTLQQGPQMRPPSARHPRVPGTRSQYTQPPTTPRYTGSAMDTIHAELNGAITGS
jgi:hypothetical protein